MRREKTGSGHAYALLLFAILLLSVLFLAGAGTGAYRVLVQAQTAHSTARANLSYVSARVRADDVRHMVRLKEGPQGAMLVLAEEEGYETRIYLYDGALREEYALQTQPCSPQSADAVAPAERFEACALSPFLLEVTTELGTVRVAVRSGIETGGGADA